MSTLDRLAAYNPTPHAARITKPCTGKSYLVARASVKVGVGECQCGDEVEINRRKVRLCLVEGKKVYVPASCVEVVK